MTRAIIVTEDVIIEKIRGLLDELDADELTRITHELFGVECYYFADAYYIYPDENYCGDFGEIE